VLFTPAGIERFFDAFAVVADRNPETFARIGKEEADVGLAGPPLAQSDPL
jgi:hypothetical protein